MYVNIINRKFRRQNIIIYVIMNLHYSFVIIICKSLLQNQSLCNAKHVVLLCNGYAININKNKPTEVTC